MTKFKYTKNTQVDFRELSEKVQKELIEDASLVESLDGQLVAEVLVDGKTFQVFGVPCKKYGE